MEHRQLETRRLRLRRVSLDDADLMLAVWNDPAFLEHVGDRGVRSEDEARAEIESGALRLFDDHGYGPFAMEFRSDDTKIGICGLFKREHLDAPDIGFAVLPDFCGRGFAAEAAVAVLRHACDDLGITTLTAIVSPGNAPSIGLIEKLGFSFARMITMPGNDEEICLYRTALNRESYGILQE